MPMNQFFKIFFFFFLIAICTTAGAQKSPGTDSTNAPKELSFPPLGDLIDSALQHNALVRFRTLEIDAKQCNLLSWRNYWLRNLGVQGDSRYGNIDAFSTNANGVSSSVLNSSSRQFNYAAGIYFKIPVFDIVNRKTEIRQAKTELEQAKFMAISQQDETRQLVIRQYQDLVLKQKLLLIKSQNLGTATANMELVEKEFKNGVLPLVEYVRISDITARIQSDYEYAKSDFLLSKQIMEELVGFSLGKTTVK